MEDDRTRKAELYYVKDSWPPPTYQIAHFSLSGMDIDMLYFGSLSRTISTGLYVFSRLVRDLFSSK